MRRPLTGTDLRRYINRNPCCLFMLQSWPCLGQSIPLAKQSSSVRGMNTRTDNANKGPADGSLDPEEAAIDCLSKDNHSQEHLQVNTVSQRQVTMDGEGLRPGARGVTTQTIPSRCVRSPRRLLELLKTKYGQDGYSVEMRHNVYTVVTKDGKGKLSQDEIQNC